MKRGNGKKTKIRLIKNTVKKTETEKDKKEKKNEKGRIMWWK